MKIGFMGLGKLGLPSALAIESRGHEVVGYDLDPAIDSFLEDMKIPYLEKDIEPLLEKTKIELVKPDEMIGDCDIIFVAVQTPHDPEFEGVTRLPADRKDFNYAYLKDAITMMADRAKKKKVNQVVAIISTVIPGTIDEIIQPIIKGGDNHLKLVYNPFFIAMGTTVGDFLDPEFVLLGVDDPHALKVVENFYKLTIDWDGYKERIFTCSIKTAEAIKVMYNTYITQKICFANAAMELCHHTGADVDDLTDALGMGTKRITSTMYMRGGMGDGGGCHPRDNIALSAVARKHKMSYDWWANLMLAREKQTGWFATILMRYHTLSGLPIKILGKAFKPETNLTDGSPSILLYNLLKEKVQAEADLEIYDPYVDSRIDGEGDIVIFQSPVPSIIFIGTKHAIFASTKWPAGSVIIDPWRYIPDQEEVTIKRLGEGE